MIKQVVTRANCIIFFGSDLCELGFSLPFDANISSSKSRVYSRRFGVPPSGNIYS